MSQKASSVYRRLLSYSFEYKGVWILSLFGMVVYAATDAGLAMLTQPMLDDGFVKNDPDAIRTLPFLLVLLFVIRGLGGFFSVFGMQWLGYTVIRTMRAQVFEHYLRLPTTFYDNESTGVLISKLTFNIEQVAEAATRSVTVLIRDSLTILFLLAVMLYQQPFLSIFVLITAPIIGWLVKWVGKRFRRYSDRIQDSMGDLTKIAEEAVSGHRVIKVFGGEDYEREGFTELNESNRKLRIRFAGTHAGSMPVIQFIAGVAIATIVYFATQGSPFSEPMTAGEFGTFLAAMLLLMAPLKRLTDINATIQKAVAASGSVFDLLDETIEPDSGLSIDGRCRGDLTFSNVGFSYTTENAPVLSGFNLTVSAGESVAIVGRSGSGKSTLVSLLPRFYEPTDGEIHLDGQNYLEFRLADLRAQIALVSQDVVLFNDTIARNIAYGNQQNAKVEDIVAAAEAAHVMEFVNDLPKGLDTLVGDRGVLLSGGQRQRIAIARALLKNAPILILDEATSALDSESERAIQSALEVLMQNRTTLVIAHRLSTIENADKIVVLDQGRLLEAGSHKDLLAKGGHYAMLHRMQFRDDA
ncbi:MAG: lipid A export permease/ATP-binding protein MsbA [Pseudomonadota bacterium]